MGRHEPYHSSADRGGSARAPDPVRGAEWQAGVTPGNAGRKVLIDGEPAPLAFAASATGGWALLYPQPSLTRVRPTEHAPLGLAERIDPFAGATRVTGRVAIVAGDHC